MTYANGMFLATANDGFVLISSNGLDWEQRPLLGISSGVSNLRSATYASGVWIIPGNQGVVLTSTDATNWVRRYCPTFENLHGARYLGGSFVVIGNRGTVLQSGSLARAPFLAGRSTSEGFEVSVIGETGVPYRLQATTSLLGNAWVDLFHFTSDAPITTVRDTGAQNLSRRFYRLVTP